MRKISHSLINGRAGAGTGGQGLKVEWDSTNDGELHWLDVDESSLEYVAPTWNGGRGVIGGGPSSPKNRIQYITINTPGNSVDFGDLTLGRENIGALSNGSRGVFAGGEYSNVIEYITISTTGNGTDFGDLTFGSPSYNVEGSCNGTRGIFQGGHQSATNVLDYITVATTGNASFFGTLSSNRYYGGQLGDATRSITGGGSTGGTGGVTNIIDYVAYATTGNATDFGDLTASRYKMSGMSDTTRGVFTVGEAAQTSMDYITIATTGNATDFGDRSISTNSYGPASCSDGTYGVMCGGVDASYGNTIDYITIQTTGNAVDFGDLLEGRGYAAACAGD